MRVAFLTLALSALVALVPAASAADSICSAAETCYITGGSKKCDRTKSDCPPCLYKRFLSTSYQCYYLDDDKNCPDETTYCPPASGSSSSGSSSGSTTPEPTTTTPKPTTKKPTTKKPSGSSSGSTSGSASESGSSSSKTPKPTTAKPTTKPPTTTTPAPTPTPTPNVTETVAPLTTSSPTNAQSTQSDTSSSKLPLILGVACGGFVVIAVIAFLVWRRRRDDDEDSDDDDFRFNPPKPTGRIGAAGAGAGSVATTASYNNSDQMRIPTSPGAKAGAAGMAGYAAGGAAGGAAAGQYGAAKYGGGNQYSSNANQYSSNANQYGQYGAAPVYGTGAANDYGSPSTIDGSSRNLFASGVNPSYDNRDSLSDSLSSNDDRDVWGNQPALPAPGGYTSTTAAAQQPVYPREKRTLSNVSVEF